MLGNTLAIRVLREVLRRRSAAVPIAKGGVRGRRLRGGGLPNSRVVGLVGTRLREAGVGSVGLATLEHSRLGFRGTGRTTSWRGLPVRRRGLRGGFLVLIALPSDQRAREGYTEGGRIVVVVHTSLWAARREIVAHISAFTAVVSDYVGRVDGPNRCN